MNGGGCECADDLAKWSPDTNSHWACHCQRFDTYESYPRVKLDPQGKLDDRNRKKCGIIVECQTVAILQLKELWVTEMNRLSLEEKQMKNINRKEFMKESGLQNLNY